MPFAGRSAFSTATAWGSGPRRRGATGGASCTSRAGTFRAREPARFDTDASPTRALFVARLVPAGNSRGVPRGHRGLAAGATAVRELSHVDESGSVRMVD